ncbi:MAG TPA: acyl-CoA dehydrogenase family protein, partial [Oligoflexia bacterium]|nr:acyl-CoA dehydrogenase family protein [Oligoflexia bacterium]
MDLFLSTELLELRSAVRDFFSEIGSRSTVLNTVPSSCDASSLAGMLSAEAVETVWNGLARDGFLAAPVPKNLGGGGLGVLAAQVLVEACGRELSPL